jgi:predicted component of viral defense system (DUF524 family)
LGELRAAAGALPDQRWWGSVPLERKRTVGAVASALREAGTHGMWAEVGRMHAFPAASRVLQRREGYRAMLELWTAFHRARRPLFEPLRHAMDVRDVATLYEVWAYFRLVEEIAVLLDHSPVLELRTSDAQGLRWESVARFGDAGELVYNRYGSSYSVPLRPDFTWRRGGKTDVVLDAKFRLDRAALEDEGDDTPQATAKRADLYKMHAYRDALGVRAAVIVYPGTESMFYHRDGRRQSGIAVRSLLEDNVSGVGAIQLSPRWTGESLDRRE